MALQPFSLKQAHKNNLDPNTYLQEWFKTSQALYLTSSPYRALSKAKQKSKGVWFKVCSQLFVDFLGEELREIDVDAIETILMIILPTEINVPESEIKTVIPDLLAYWQYLDALFNSGARPKLKYAKAIIEHLAAVEKSYPDLYRAVAEDAKDWVPDFIGDAAYYMSTQGAVPIELALQLTDLNSFAEFLGYLCNSGFDQTMPGASDAVYELLNVACRESFIQVRHGDSDATRFWQHIAKLIMDHSRFRALDAESLNILFTILAEYRQFLSAEFIAFIHEHKMAHLDDEKSDEREEAPFGIEELVEEMPDEFTLVEVMQEQLAFLPDVQLQMILEEINLSEKGRNAIALMVLDSNQQRAKIALNVLKQAPKSLPAAALGRLVRIRNWLNRSVQNKADKLIQLARKRGVSPTNADTTHQVCDVLMSTIDSYGVQCVALTLQEGNQYRIVSFLLKEHRGVVDAMVSPLTSKKETQAFIARFKQSGLLFEKVSFELIAQQLPLFLAMNRQFNTSIDPFLVQCMELLGLKNWNPDDAMLHTLYQDLLDVECSDDVIAKVQKRSAKWISASIGNSWFNDFEPSVDGRLVWAQRMGRMTLWAKHCHSSRRQAQCHDFAVVCNLLMNKNIPEQDIALLRAIERNSY